MRPSVTLSRCFAAALAVAAAAVPARAVGSLPLKPLLDELKEDPYLDAEKLVMDARQQFMVVAEDEKSARAALNVAVRHRARAQRFFGTSIIWKAPALILIYPDRDAYYDAWGPYVWGTGGVQAQFRYKGHKVKLIVTFEGKRLLDHTLPHELMHLLVYDMSNRQYFDGRRADVVEVPMWVQEGLAEYMTADAERREDFERIVYYALYVKKPIPLRRMLAKLGYDERIVLHYAQSYSFMAFLASTVPNGRMRLRNFLTSFNEPDLAKNPVRAFQLAFQGVAPSAEALEAYWHAWVAKQYRHHFAPVVVRTKPADEAKDAAHDGKIWIQFDKPLDADTLNAKTIALRKGDAARLGDDAGNLVREAALSYDSAKSILLIHCKSGLSRGTRYTLALSNRVRDAQKHDLVAEKFDEMKDADWWHSDDIEPEPDQEAKKKKEAPLKAVVSITFTTPKEARSGSAPR